MDKLEGQIRIPSGCADLCRYLKGRAADDR